MSIFNTRDHKPDSEIYTLDELDERFINEDGDAIDNLAIKRIQMYDTSTISFGDLTEQTTAFSQEYQDNIQSQINDMNANNVLPLSNVFTGDVNDFKEIKGSRIQIKDSSNNNNMSTLSMAGVNTSILNPLNGSKINLIVNALGNLYVEKTYSFTDTNLDMGNKGLIKVSGITFNDSTTITPAKINNIATNTSAITSIQSVNNTQNSNISANAKIAGAFYRFQPSSTDMRFNGITNFNCNGSEVTGIKRLILNPDTGTSGGGMIHSVGATDLRIHANFFGSSGGAIVLKTNLNSTGSSKDAKLTHADFNLNSRTITGCTNLDTITSNVTQLITDVATISDNLGNYNQSILIADDFANGYISLQKTQNGSGGGPEWSNRSTNSYNSNDRAETQDSIAGHPGIVRLYIASSINDDVSVYLGLRRLPCTWGDTEKVEIIYMVPDGQSQYNFTVEIGLGESKDLNNSAIIRCQNNGNYTFEINRGTPSATSAVAGIRKNKWMILTITNTGSGNCLFTLKNMTDNTTESYNYTGGALSMSALITPWVGLRNRSGTTPTSNRYMYVDYMSIRYKCASRA